MVRLSHNAAADAPYLLNSATFGQLPCRAPAVRFVHPVKGTAMDAYVEGKAYLPLRAPDGVL